MKFFKLLYQVIIEILKLIPLCYNLLVEGLEWFVETAGDIEKETNKLALETKASACWKHYERLKSPKDKIQKLDELKSIYSELKAITTTTSANYRSELKRIAVEREAQEQLRNSHKVKYHPNGKVALISPLRDGSPHGTTKQWSSTGQLIFSAEYKCGIVTGQVLEWYEDGQLRVSRSYENGRKIGVSKYWTESGTHRYTLVFTNKLEAMGNIEAYYPDGSTQVSFIGNTFTFHTSDGITLPELKSKIKKSKKLSLWTKSKFVLKCLFSITVWRLAKNQPEKIKTIFDLDDVYQEEANHLLRLNSLTSRIGNADKFTIPPISSLRPKKPTTEPTITRGTKLEIATPTSSVTPPECLTCGQRSLTWKKLTNSEWHLCQDASDRLHHCADDVTGRVKREELIEKLISIGFEVYIPRTSTWSLALIKSNTASTIYILIGKRNVSLKFFDETIETKIDTKGRLYTKGGLMIRKNYQESGVNIHVEVLSLAQRFVSNKPLTAEDLLDRGITMAASRSRYIGASSGNASHN